MDIALDTLNPKQREAVVTTEGPILILAGPGSGKTKTLTYRIAYLLSRGVLPENILAVTFTNKAAQEMRERITALTKNMGLDVKNLFMGTFHSLAARILRAHANRVGFLPNFTIYDADDSLSLVKEVISELAVPPKQFPAGMVSKIISASKNELKTSDIYREETGGDHFSTTIFRIYDTYTKKLYEANAMDFDDLLLNVCLLFQKEKTILEIYQNQFRYINVDEYQDVNHAQYIFTRRLAENHRNIAVVGDDAQAIYAFRGADFRNILNFERDWPDATTITLDQNYRSTQNLLDAAAHIINKNTFQKKKALWTEKKEGDTVTVAALEDERKEAEFVLDRIHELQKDGYALSDMAILYRTNAQSRPFEESFLGYNIPYMIIGGIRFYQRKEIKDIVAYIRFLINERDIVSLKRVMNVPPRGIGKKLFLSVLSGDKTILGQPKIAEWNQLVETLKKEMASMPVSLFLKDLLKRIHYRSYLEETTMNADERWENVEELISLASRYDHEEIGRGTERFAEDIALFTENDEAGWQANAIRLMTLHAAKGLEFPIIFLVGLEEGIFPHTRSTFSNADLEEERRLCYVGLTRAKEKAFLTFALRRYRFGSTTINPPSRFITEIPEKLTDIYPNPL